MNKDLEILLSGVGFYKLSERRRRIIRNFLLVSLGVHVIGLLLFGSYVVMKAATEETPTFDATPAMKTYEPKKLELKVKVQKRQRSSSRPSMVPRLVSTKVSTLALPEIKVDPKIIKTSFQPKFKAVSGTGLGAGLGTGYGLGGFGDGVSTFDFFGIRGRGERIAILVDVSISMIEEERGGSAGYWKVKERINKVIDALNEGSLFNVFVFADAASAWEKEMQIATKDNKGKAKLWLRPFNTEGNWGLTQGNLKTSDIGLQAAGGTTRLDLPLTAAFEQGADTILVISDGLPRVGKVVSMDQQRAYENQRANWAQQNQAAIQQWQQAQAAVTYTEEKVWIPPTPARPPRKPTHEGDRGDAGAPAQPGRWEVRRVSHGGYPRPQPPPPPAPGWWSLSDFVEHLRILHEKLYVEKGKKLPVIHAIGYAIDKDGGDFLRELAETYKGRYRRVARID